MADEDLRDAERAWRASPSHLDLERAYLVAWERAGCPGRDPRREPSPGDWLWISRETAWLPAARWITQELRVVVSSLRTGRKPRVVCQVENGIAWHEVKVHPDVWAEQTIHARVLRRV